VSIIQETLFLKEYVIEYRVALPMEPSYVFEEDADLSKPPPFVMAVYRPLRGDRHGTYYKFVGVRIS